MSLNVSSKQKKFLCSVFKFSVRLGTFLFKQKPEKNFLGTCELEGCLEPKKFLLPLKFFTLVKGPTTEKSAICYKFHHFEFLSLGGFLLRELSLSETSSTYFSSFLKQI